MKNEVRARALFGRLQKAMAGDAGLTDGQLLGRYIAGRDEAAFAALVRRHGPMVLAVCRRVLRHAQDAEDAFQAAFLVLARKAASLSDREAVGGWLHGVACRAAWAARAAALRRKAKEQQVTDMPTAVGPPQEDRRELLELLDRELARLPPKYRLPVVLCELEGRSRREAALQLGLPEGTLSSRLSRARGLLAARLGRCGLAVSGAALAALLAKEAGAACVPGPLVVSTVRTAGGSMTAATAALAEGVMKAMLLTKLTGATWGLLLAAALSVGAVAWTYQAAPAQSAPARPAQSLAATSAERDDLEALRLEVEALRRSLQATRQRVQALEAEVQAQKKQTGGDSTPACPREALPTPLPAAGPIGAPVAPSPNLPWPASDPVPAPGTGSVPYAPVQGPGINFGKPSAVPPPGPVLPAPGANPGGAENPGDPGGKKSDPREAPKPVNHLSATDLSSGITVELVRGDLYATEAMGKLLWKVNNVMENRDAAASLTIKGDEVHIRHGAAVLKIALFRGMILSDGAEKAGTAKPPGGGYGAK